MSCEKSTPPSTAPIGGMMMSLTRDATTAPSAAPMMTPTANARAFVFSRNARNSDNIRTPSSSSDPGRLTASPAGPQRDATPAPGPLSTLPAMDKAFVEAMRAGYDLKEPSLVIGSPLLKDELLPDVRVQVALSMLNRHGLIAGATGTGKTKTLQLLAGQLSDAGVPVFVADIKGDVTGIAAPGNADDPKVKDRAASLHWEFKPSGHPVEFLSLSGKLGAQVRATVHSFGPLLLGKVMDLNETQTSVLSLIFKYCDDNALPLLDLADLRTTLQYLTSDDGKATLADYG